MSENSFFKISAFFISLSITICEGASAQTLTPHSNIIDLQANGICDSNGYCQPGIEGLSRPKGIIFNYKNVLNYSINSEFNDKQYSEEITRDRVSQFKIRLPVLLKPSFKFLMGFEYSGQKYKFKDNLRTDNDFFVLLNRKPLQTLALKFYTIKAFKPNKYLAARVGFRLSGDYANKLENPLLDYLRASATVLYGFKLSRDLTWGAGLSFSYTFGRRILLPILSYEKRFNDYLSIELALPYKIELRYGINPSNILLFVNRVSGDRYNIYMPTISSENLYLESSSFISKIRFEKEIYDFLWGGIDIGYRRNVEFGISTENNFQRRNNPLFTNRLTDGLILNTSIFLVPPKKFKQK